MPLLKGHPMRLPTLAAALALLLSAPAASADTDDERQQFVDANVLWVFYHELGHALIDQLDLPVLGKEEDAADQLAVFLTDELWDDTGADRISDLVASGFWRAAEDAKEPAPWWDEHSTDQQRHFTVACLYYGGDPARRGHVVKDVGLPDDRAELCVAERDQVDRAWGGVLDDLSQKRLPGRLVFRAPQADPTHAALSRLLADEVALLNDALSLPADLTVTFAPCGEENAFYDPETREIEICTEFADLMDRLHGP